MMRKANPGYICDMVGVREYCEGASVELWRDDKTGRLAIRAYDDSEYGLTSVDLLGILDWLSNGPYKYLLKDYVVGFYDVCYNWDDEYWWSCDV